MCYEPKSKPECSCGHSGIYHEDTEHPVLAENKEGPCMHCECQGYDGLPPHHPNWILAAHRGEAMTLESALRRAPRQQDGEAPKDRPESYYRDMLARQVGGLTEVTLPFGRADVLTDTTIYEVEPAARWRDGVAQALQYAAQVPQRGAIALYGNGVPLSKVHAGLASLPAPGLELWWLAGDLFVRVKEIKSAA